jgi:hypothetical protein
MASGERDVLRTERPEQSDTIGIVAKEREIGVLESGGDRASDEAVGAPRSGCLPPVCGRNLHGLSRPGGGAHNQHVDLSDGGRRKKQIEGVALVEVPQLVRANAMLAAVLPTDKQEIDAGDRCAVRALVVWMNARGRAMDLAEVAALGVRLKAEVVNQLTGTRMHEAPRTAYRAS